MRAVSSTNVFFCWAGAALVVLAVGCGGDDSSSGTTKGSGGSGGSGATGGSDMTGGSGGSGGTTGGTAGTGGSGGSSVPDGGAACGTTICPPPMFGMACCTANNTCGFLLGMTCIDPNGFDAGTVPEAGTGNPDPNCGTATIGPFMLAGCCMSDNTCGFVNQLGGGCVTADQVRMFPGAILPDAPMTCTYIPPSP